MPRPGRCGNLIMPSGSIWIGSFSSSSRNPLGFWSNSSTSPFGIEAMKCSEATSVTALAVRRDHQVIRLRQGGDAAAFGKAPGPRDIGLHDVDGAASDQLAKAVEADLGFVTGDRRGERLGDARTAVDVVGRDRLLDPVHLIGLERAAHFD